jgi:hypothetical protein
MCSAFRILAALILLTLIAPRTAQAVGYLSPALGIAFGNPSAQGRANFAADIGWLPREPIGVELDVMYAPSFFGNQGPYGENSVTTIMGNVIVAATDRGRYGIRQRGPSIRPYLSGGLGLMHETVTAPVSAQRLSNDDLGLNAGVGLMALARRSVGVRGDLRYFRDLVGKQTGAVDFGSFHFWRASIGLMLTF